MKAIKKRISLLCAAALIALCLSQLALAESGSSKVVGNVKEPKSGSSSSQSSSSRPANVRDRYVDDSKANVNDPRPVIEPDIVGNTRGKKTEASSKAAEKSSAPKASISSTSIDPGETLFITVSGVKDIKAVTVKNDFGFSVRLSADPSRENTYIGFLPVSYFTAKGSYNITVSGGGLSTATFTVAVSGKQFETQYLTVDEGLANSTINNDEASKEYREVIWPQKEKFDSKRYFDGRFILPVQGGINTQFGMVRYTNGVAGPRHDGVDLDAKLGTPVKAAQNGKVLYAGFVKLTGNTVVIEHGYGLKSWYQHMQSLSVKEGDVVKTGQVIGKVGSTGFSTGPHMHFSASINGVYINPLTLVETDLLERAAK